MMYYRPIAMTDAARPPQAQPLAGGRCWFSHVEILQRGGPSRLAPLSEVPETVLARLTAPRAALAGLACVLAYERLSSRDVGVCDEATGIPVAMVFGAGLLVVAAEFLRGRP